MLPWRTDGGMTECGMNAAKVPTMTRDEFAARLKDLGQNRTAILTCWTCSDTARRWGTWEDDPRQALNREIQWEGARYQERGHRLRDELVAIAALIETHREEFDAHVAHDEQRRQWIDRKNAIKRPVPKERGL